MNVGWNTYQHFLDLNDNLNTIGLKLSKPKNTWIDVDTVAVTPLGDHGAPCYNRDSELFVGTLKDIETWYIGYSSGMNYLKHIQAVTPEKIAKCEQNIRNQQLLKALKK